MLFRYEDQQLPAVTCLKHDPCTLFPNVCLLEINGRADSKNNSSLFLSFCWFLLLFARVLFTLEWPVMPFLNIKIRMDEK